MRGYQVEEVELAIEFEFDSTQMTPKGEGYAMQLRDYLLDRNPSSIVLEGHTDPTGSADYNESLSLKRALSLRNFLMDQGYTGSIDVFGRGESDVPAPPSGVEHGSPEHHQIARRVTLIRG